MSPVDRRTRLNADSSRYAGPDTQRAAEAMRMLERSHDDARISDWLGRHDGIMARDAQTGAPMPHFVYRLDCGCLVDVWTLPLAPDASVLFCGECREQRRLVERLS